MQMYKKFRKELKKQGLKREDRNIIIKEIQDKYEPLMQMAEVHGKTMCPSKMRFLPMVTFLLKEYGFKFQKEGENLYLYKN